MDNAGEGTTRSGREVSQTSAKPLSILVVDDEDTVAEVTRRMLTSLGHTVQVATRIDDVRVIWQEWGSRLDLLICDVVMPEMKGPELVERLVGASTRPRVLFITGYSEETTRLAHPVLGKPFTFSALTSAIEAALAD
jgi:two-component system cell cycle sensor histidine kinase/response regulator CckA